MYEEWDLDDTEIEKIEAWVASNPKAAAVVLCLVITVLDENVTQRVKKFCEGYLDTL